MRLLSVLMISCLVLCVYGKGTNLKPLTESMGQEVIEIGPPVKDLPPEIEEEPSAEVDDDNRVASTAASPQPATKAKEVLKKVTPETRRKSKDMDADEDDARIEKELSEIYKDSTDYKDVSEDPTKANSTAKPIGRAGANFKFQPDLNNQREVERFRTSIDEISCAKSVTRLTVDTKEKNTGGSGGGSAGHSLRSNLTMLLSTISMTVLFICTC